MKRPLSRSQIVCIILLWVALCYIVLVYAERIDGPTIVMLIISAALVFIPVYKSLKKNKYYLFILFLRDKISFLIFYPVFLYKMFASSIFIFTFATARENNIRKLINSTYKRKQL